MADGAEHSHAASTEMPQATEGSGAFPPFESANFAPLLIWLVLTFGVLYLLMAKIAMPRVEGILKSRRGKIDGDIGLANAKREEADRAAADYQMTLADAKARAQALAQETHVRLATETEVKRRAIEADLAGKLTAAEAQIAATKAKAMSNVDQIARDTAAAIVEHITGKPADPAAIAAAFLAKA
ncbi:MAG: F0F1 ATP synthase subunit B' [Beijerinckiaceae bacterium]